MTPASNNEQPENIGSKHQGTAHRIPNQKRRWTIRFPRKHFGFYLEARRLLARSLLPYGGISFVAAGVFLVGFVYIIGREVKLFNPTAWTLVLFLVMAAFFILPSRAIIFWLNLPLRLQSFASAILAYVAVVLLGHLPDVVSFSAVWEILTLTQGAPFSASHFLGLLSAAYLIKRPPPRAEPKDVLIRGPVLIPHSLAAEQSLADIEARSKQGKIAPSIFWGGVPLALARGSEHFCIVGEPGSGKSISLRMLLQTLVPHIYPGAGRRALIYDAKRDTLPLLSGMKTACEVKPINPFDSRSYAWDMAADVGDDPRLPIELASIIVSLESDKPFFPRAAQALVGGLIKTLQFLTTNKTERWTLRDVVLALRYPSRVKTILTAGGISEYLIEIYIGDDPAETERSITATIQNAVDRLSFVAGAWDDAARQGKVFTLREWLNSDYIIVLGSDPEGETIMHDLQAILLRRLDQMVRALDDRTDNQTWIVLDELRHMGKIDALPGFLTFSRSKGACVVLGFQDIGGLEHVYGQGGEKLAREIANACSNKAFLRTTDTPTQKFASESFGDQEVDVPRWSYQSGSSGSSQTFSYQRERRPLVLPAQFSSDLPRPDKSMGYGISGYYQTAAVHQPYLATLQSDVIEKTLSKVGAEPSFVRRDIATYELREWDEKDLARLGLSDHSNELLRKKPGDDKSGSWRDVFRPKS